jgi:hypothetical protein
VNRLVASGVMVRKVVDTWKESTACNATLVRCVLPPDAQAFHAQMLEFIHEKLHPHTQKLFTLGQFNSH